MSRLSSSSHHDEGIYLPREKLFGRRHSQHTFLNLKATSVIDQLKTKVHRKRLSKNESLDLSDTTIHSLANDRQSTSDSFPELAPTSAGSPFNALVANESILSDVSQKLIKLKPKLIKATKSLPEPTDAAQTKKRRQTLRRMAFQIRDEDFNGIFNDLPSDEQLIIAYPCGWRKDVFMHGRLFLSVNHLSFYTCFFKWEESLSVAYEDIVSVTREKSAKLVPNAIKIRTKNGDQFVFASYIPRERIFIAIFRLWQNALLELPLDYQQLRALVYTDQQAPDTSSIESDESIVLENTARSASESHSLPPTSGKSSAQSSPRLTSLPLEHTRMTYHSACTCHQHLSKTYADRLFSFNVDTLFELIFGDNSFTRTFRKSQKLTDYSAGDWTVNAETKRRERQTSYRTVAQSLLGTNALSCHEKQTMDAEKPHSMYIVSSEVHNEGMKYTDAFYVATRFCMFQRDAEHSSLRITAEIRYLKNVNSFVKSFIEKNAHASMEHGIQDQVQRLENQQVKNIAEQSSHQDKKPPSDSTPPPRILPVDQPTSRNPLRIHSLAKLSLTGPGMLYNIALLVGLFLLGLHIYLCYKLHSFDRILSTANEPCLDECQKSCTDDSTPW